MHQWNAFQPNEHLSPNKLGTISFYRSVLIAIGYQTTCATYESKLSIDFRDSHKVII